MVIAQEAPKANEPVIIFGQKICAPIKRTSRTYLILSPVKICQQWPSQTHNTSNQLFSQTLEAHLSILTRARPRKCAIGLIMGNIPATRDAQID